MAASLAGILAAQQATQEAADDERQKTAGEHRSGGRVGARLRQREVRQGAQTAKAKLRAVSFFSGMLWRLRRQRAESGGSGIEPGTSSQERRASFEEREQLRSSMARVNSDRPSSAARRGASPRHRRTTPPTSPPMSPARPTAQLSGLSSLQRVSFDLLRMLETTAVQEEKRSRQLQRVYSLYEFAGQAIADLGSSLGGAQEGEQDGAAPRGGGRGRSGSQTDSPSTSQRRLSAPTLSYLQGAELRAGDGVAPFAHTAGDVGADNEKPPTAQLLEVLRVRVWDMMSEPESGPVAMAISVVILLLIMVGSVTFCMETMSQFQDEDEEPLPSLRLIELVSIVVFSSELTVKLASCPSIKGFFSSYLNWIDVLAVLPFYVELAAASLDLKGTRVLRIVRLVRVFRVLKLGGKFEKLQVVSSAMRDSMDMLAMMMFLLILSIIIFSTLAYFCEEGHHDCPAEAQWCLEEGTVPEGFDGDLDDCIAACPYNYFQSIPHAFWWCMVTLMTVGYGDAVTVTVLGKVVASITMVVSVLILALPISVIGANFTTQWMDFKKRRTSGERVKKLAPQFRELSDIVRDHDSFFGEVVRKIRDLENELDDSIESLREKVTLIQSLGEGTDDSKSRRTSSGSTKRLLSKAVRRGFSSATAAQQAAQQNSSNMRKLERLFDEVDEIVISVTEARAKLLQLLVIVQQMVCEGFIPCLDEARRKYKRLDVLIEDWTTMQADTEEVTDAIDELAESLCLTESEES